MSPVALDHAYSPRSVCLLLIGHILITISLAELTIFKSINMPISQAYIDLSIGFPVVTLEREREQWQHH